MSNEFPGMWNHYIELNHAESSFLIMFFFLTLGFLFARERGNQDEKKDVLRIFRKKKICRLLGGYLVTLEWSNYGKKHIYFIETFTIVGGSLLILSFLS